MIRHSTKKVFAPRPLELPQTYDVVGGLIMFCTAGESQRARYNRDPTRLSLIQLTTFKTYDLLVFNV